MPKELEEAHIVRFVCIGGISWKAHLDGWEGLGVDVVAFVKGDDEVLILAVCCVCVCVVEGKVG